MYSFEDYLKDVYSQLVQDDKNSRYIKYNYTKEQVDNYKLYFENCFHSGLSAYKALLFFDDYLKGEYIF